MPKFQVEKSIVIQAAPERVFEALADYGTWTTWSPWLIAEPEAKVTVSRNPSSIGSTYAWAGQITGEGILEHKILEPYRLIEDDLNFLKPFKSYARTVFRLTPTNGGTNVRWSMDSSLPWFMFWMVDMMKTFIGMDYARGLAMLKEWIETGTITSQSNIHGIEQLEAIRMAGIAATSPVDQVGLSMEEAIKAAQAEFKRLGIPMDREMISVYTKFRIKQGSFDYISGYLIPDNVQIPANSPLKVWSLPPRKAFRVEHIGSYHHLGNGWSIANQIARHRKLKQCRSGTFEIYRTVPPAPEADLVTDIYLPLK